MTAVPSPDQTALRREPQAEPDDRINDASNRSTTTRPADYEIPGDSDAFNEPSTAATVAERGTLWLFMLGIGKRLSTLVIALVALLVALVTWQYYVTSPWTRNGSVRVQVASIAPLVSGQIVELRVIDNQFVHKGDVLYVVDPVDYEVAVRTNKALVDQRAADLEVKQVQSDRRQHLSDLATTPEQQQIFAGNAMQARAAFDAAEHQLAQAELNLQRTRVLSPVNGYVTNLLLRAGNYAVAGVTNIVVIDSDSYWIDGYFEETKMAGICVGDRAEANLLGYGPPIVGHVKTVTRGISVSNAASGTQGLPNVDPIYTWVRLAQRVPVRIALDEVPPGIPLVSGMTATVTVRPAASVDHENWFSRARKEVGRLPELFTGPSPSRPDCVPARPEPQHQTESISVPQEPPTPSLKQISPGLAPGLTVSPRKN